MENKIKPKLEIDEKRVKYKALSITGLPSGELELEYDDTVRYFISFVSHTSKSGRVTLAFNTEDEISKDEYKIAFYNAESYIKSQLNPLLFD